MSTSRRGFFRRMFTALGAALFPGRAAKSDPAEATEAIPGAEADFVPEPARPRWQSLEFDVVVVGGGIAGTCCAIAAARHGARVALVHNRPMLGGNSSSEVKLYPENNSAHQPWIKEGGIHEEFHTEERVRNHQPYIEGLMNCHWDLVLYEWAIREPNLTLFLNTHVYEALKSQPDRIRAVRGLQLGTEKFYEFTGSIFVDCTGDGYLGHLAGAVYRWGREGRDEFQEPLAPPRADEKVMGNTLFFRALKMPYPVPFKRPDWAAEFPTEEDLTHRYHGFVEGGYWWIEVGAPYHPIQDNDKITHELLRQLLGVWDHIKNKGDHGAENYGLEFVGFWPYKRECRRIRGDYILTQHHVQDPPELPDAVAYGCWGIDIHVQGGILARRKRPYPPPRLNENWETYGTLVYPIPLRALYSRNIVNLMMAGRPISCTYIAFASSRVLSTGAIVGQAVGTAAAVAVRRGVAPREVARRHIREVQQILLRDDCYIPGVANEDPNDLARMAKVTASSDWPLTFPEKELGAWSLARPLAQIFPVSEPRLERVWLKLISTRSEPTPVKLGLRPAPYVWDFRADVDLAQATAVVPPKRAAWVSFDLGVELQPRRLYYVHLAAQPGIRWAAHRDKPGEPSLVPPGVTPADLPGKKRWRPAVGGRAFLMRVEPECRPYGPENVNRGTNRPDRWTNIWISDPTRGLPAWLELRWDEPVEFDTVQLTFDTDALKRVTLPLFRYPECVRAYRLMVETGGGWQEIVREADNYVRRRVHRFDPVRTRALRIVVEATNGAPSARIYEVRVYREQTG